MKPYFYLQSLSELIDKACNYDKRFYIFSSPKNKQLSAMMPYRRYLEQNFDVVLVEEGCYLEPSYVVITSVPELSDPPINIVTIKEKYRFDSHV